MMKPYLTILSLIVIPIVVVACSQGSTSTPQPPAPTTHTAPTAQPAAEAAAAPVETNKGKTLLEAECVKCHNIGRVTGFSEKVSWKEIVDRMITKHGAKISTEDAAVITEYLDKTLPRK